MADLTARDPGRDSESEEKDGTDEEEIFDEEAHRARCRQAAANAVAVIETMPYFALLERTRHPWFRFFRIRDARPLHVEPDCAPFALQQVALELEELSADDDWRPLGGHSSVILARRNWPQGRCDGWFGPYPDVNGFAGLVALARAISARRDRLLRLAERSRRRIDRLEARLRALATRDDAAFDAPEILSFPHGVRLTAFLAPGKTFLDGPRPMWVGPVLYGRSLYIGRALTKPVAPRRSFACRPEGLEIRPDGGVVEAALPAPVVAHLDCRKPYNRLWYDDDHAAVLQRILTSSRPKGRRFLRRSLQHVAMSRFGGFLLLATLLRRSLHRRNGRAPP